MSSESRGAGWVRGAVVVIATGAAILAVTLSQIYAVPPMAPAPIDLFEAMGTDQAAVTRINAALTILDDPSSYHPLLVRTAISVVDGLRDERGELGLASIVADGTALGGRVR